MLNSELKKNNQPFVKLIPSNEVCPYIDGLQSLEEDARQKETIPYQGPGLCSAWSMFFTELTLKNPTISSNELLNIIMNKFDKEPDKQAKYIRQIIIGYIKRHKKRVDFFRGRPADIFRRAITLTIY